MRRESCLCGKNMTIDKVWPLIKILKVHHKKNVWSTRINGWDEIFGHHDWWLQRKSPLSSIHVRRVRIQILILQRINLLSPKFSKWLLTSSFVKMLWARKCWENFLDYKRKIDYKIMLYYVHQYHCIRAINKANLMTHNNNRIAYTVKKK